MKNISELEERLNMILDGRYAKVVGIHKGFVGLKEFILEQFKSGLGDDVDDALNAVQGLRRKIQNYVKDFPSGYEEYKEKVLKGCELIQDAHYDFLEDAHNGKYKVAEGVQKMCNNNRKLITFDKKSQMEENFDRISDENYERIDREVMQNIRDLDRKIDRWARYEKTPWFFYGFLNACVLILTGVLIYYLATFLISKI